ncbi:ribosome maturation factor RimM [Lyticum sinuosum]|uniref:Ribosome maturation factor RimM n=1 Tax=Lyticum sinuosum TaxID=1332059 RepID=A0AAE4VLX9_9RICK|nr:hypothetical protein [Lyticum sinuosum]MDZ5761098.1 Ribosome maturation factor RimM [Lyticum sinuosum]
MVWNTHYRKRYINFGIISTTHCLQGAVKLRIFSDLIKKIDRFSFLEKEIDYKKANINFFNKNLEDNFLFQKNPVDNLNSRLESIFLHEVIDLSEKVFFLEKEGIYKNLGFIVKIKHIDNLVSAKKLINKKLYIDRKYLGNDFIRADLIGIPVYCDINYSQIGVIENVVNFNASDILAIQLNNNKFFDISNSSQNIKCSTFLDYDYLHKQEKKSVYYPINRSKLGIVDKELCILLQKDYISDSI